MPSSRRERTKLRRLVQAATRLDQGVAQVSTSQQQTDAVLVDAGLATSATRLRPPRPPLGRRFTTLAEMIAEYRDVATTPARRLQLLAIRSGLLPRETVVFVPPPPPGPAPSPPP